LFKKKALLSFALTASLLFSCYATGFGVTPANAETRSAANAARYIRDTVNGSTSNAGCQWIELEAWSGGKNVALHKSVTASDPAVDGLDGGVITDGVTDELGDYYYSVWSGPTWIQVDLGQQYTLDYIKVWRFYKDGRSYHDVKTQVSADGVNWTTVFDSNVSGEYQETSSGHTLCLDISVTHPSDIAFKVDPNNNTPFADAEIPLKNNSDLPVRIFVQGISRTPDGNLTLENVPPSQYPDWSKLTAAQTLSNIAFGIRVRERAPASGGWQTINQTGTVYTADMDKTLMGTLSAKGTGTLILTGNCGLAWDRQYTIVHHLSLLFKS
jgi:hypothetical protein